ncbi:GNAT family N-acetyltransferase [Arthrobacter sp. NPDC090010]|uniref:GNAT family N-acetyltransferase n=1 Tax=Arthrobacter sp. NPDC090010 TaxID=3363942 RepID=UPI00380086DF
MSKTATIETLAALSDSDADALEGLLGQLSSSATFDRVRMESLLSHDATELLVARVDDQIVGMATLVSFPLPTGFRGFVEDVVTDATMRGHGIGRLLLATMIDIAIDRGFRSLELTSRPSRETALRLYESLGFIRRDTNVLRFTPEQRI